MLENADPKQSDRNISSCLRVGWKPKKKTTLRGNMEDLEREIE